MSDRGRSPPRNPGSRGPSPSRSPASAPPGSPGGPGGRPGWPQGMGVDPAKPASGRDDKGNTRMELPPDAYILDANKDVFPIRGNKYNTEGKPEMIEVNQYRMTKFDFNKKIYQYDVSLSPPAQKIRPVMKKIWAHPAFRNALAQYNFPMWISDGNVLAWAPVLVDRGEVRVQVDLDEGRRPNAKGRDKNLFNVTIRKTTEINMAVLRGYLERKVQFNNSVQEALNFMDHLIRQWPSQNLLAIKRNFYKTNVAGRPLIDGAVVEVHKGTYASVRLSHNLAQGGIGLALNADVANTCFWIGNQGLPGLMCSFLATCDKRYKTLNGSNAAKALAPVKGDNGRFQSSDAFKQLRKMRGLRFTVRHRNRPAEIASKSYKIYDFAFDEKFGFEGANARNVTFDQDGKQVSVQDYYMNKYGAQLQFVNLPVIKTSRDGGYIPIEFAWVEPMQRYALKLNPDQTAAMIKIAVTRPQVRKADIQRNVADLQLGTDPFLRHYGVSFDNQFTKVQARVIAPPIVNFGQGSADPKFSGRWDLRGKKFWRPNSAPLQNWAIIAMDKCASQPQLQQFASTFKTTFLGHGGRCTSDALIVELPGNIGGHPANAVAHAFETLKARQRAYPQLVFIVVGHRNSPHYERLKKSTDCRFGILSQVVNAQAVMQNNGQYHSNVCMKVNAKLGGSTSRTMPPWKSNPYFNEKRPTMMIGVDISHGAPGGGTPSTAAMTMSVDPDATRFAAAVETNGYRVEMLTPKNIHFMFGQLVQQWKAGHGGSQFPAHVIYLRDGVSEGQFAHVLAEEVSQMKSYLRQAAPSKPQPKFTVIIATKRHHIRFFPQKGDKNSNPYPGTLVETEVTHPFMLDFYLSSHVAIQGTARPVHYHVILDEYGMALNEMQKMIYHQCYSYARSTTPVSLHPAVYYAHLASSRCRAHENIASSEGFRAGAKGHEMIRDAVAKGKTAEDLRGAEAPPLLTLGGKVENGKAPADGEQRQRDFFRGTMWYI
ncbi:Protein argonaute [Paramyrothecium foliicola]|nr:Protein argonaute [Paramyrothecium foliicola]